MYVRTKVGNEPKKGYFIRVLYTVRVKGININERTNE